MTIKDITTKYNMTLKAISERFDIPYRSVQNWNTGYSKCPEYVLKMIDEILTNEKNPTN